MFKSFVYLKPTEKTENEINDIFLFELRLCEKVKSVKISTYVLKKLNQSHAGNVWTLNVEYPCRMKSDSLERWYVANDWSCESRTEPNQTKPTNRKWIAQNESDMAKKIALV